MNVFALIEQTVTLETPTVESVQRLFGVELRPVDKGNRYWHCLGGEPAEGPFAYIDFRVPGEGAAKAHPFLVLDLREPSVLLDALRERYGTVVPTDVSAHHPDFIGYRMHVGDGPVRVTVDAASGAVRSFAMDFGERDDRVDP